MTIKNDDAVETDQLVFWGKEISESLVMKRNK